MIESKESAMVRRPEDLTASWLTSVLASTELLERGGAVNSFTTLPVGTGQMADTVWVAVDTGPAGAKSRSLIAKFASADEQSRSTGLMTRAYEIEVGSYSEVARHIRTRMLACYYSAIEPGTGWFVILLEDITDGVQGEQLDGCDVEVAEAALVEMAALYGPAWSDPNLAGLEWLQRGGPESDQFMAGLVTSLWPGFIERYGTRPDQGHLELCDRFMAVLGPWLAGRPAGTTVVHGDFRLDNLLLCDGDPRPFVVDWQTASWGSAASDVSYFLGGSLTVDNRRHHGRHLLRAYHDALVDHGVGDYGIDQLEEDARLLCFGGLVMSVGASMLVKRTDRGDDMFVASIARYAQQALDLEAESLLSPTAHT